MSVRKRPSQQSSSPDVLLLYLTKTSFQMQLQDVNNRLTLLAGFKILGILTLSLFSSLSHPIQLLAQPSLQWVEESNQHTKLLLETQAKSSPESAARLGLEGYDERISDLTPGFNERILERLEKELDRLDAYISTLK